VVGMRIEYRKYCIGRQRRKEENIGIGFLRKNG
jgi:hypothetical protein